MSHSRLAIFDKTGLRTTNTYTWDEDEERSIVIRSVESESLTYEEVYNYRDHNVWYPDIPPFPTPLIYLKQKRP